MKLHDIGVMAGCDKVDRHHTFKGKSYLDIYERYLSPLREESITLLELGVRDGASLTIWDKYFGPRAKIVGVDIMSSCSRFAQGRVKVEIGSQNDTEFLSKLCEEHGPFNVILDDASHINELSLASFEALHPHLTDNGIYIIEDLRNSYEDLTEDVRSWPGMHLNTGINFDNSATRKDFDDRMLKIVRDIDYRTSEFFAVHFYQQMVIMQKGF
jgi:cephalosporin hydroxylase